MGAGIYSPNNADFDFGSGNFTIDFQLYFATNSGYTQSVYQYADSSLYSNVAIQLIGDQLFYMYSTTGSSWGASGYGSHNLSTEAMHHVALVRNGTSLVAYVDGKVDKAFDALEAGATLTSPASSVAWIGLAANGAYWFRGDVYIDEFRISKGVARWTSEFTSPTAPY